MLGKLFDPSMCLWCAPTAMYVNVTFLHTARHFDHAMMQLSNLKHVFTSCFDCSSLLKESRRQRRGPIAKDLSLPGKRKKHAKLTEFQSSSEGAGQSSSEPSATNRCPRSREPMEQTGVCARPPRPKTNGETAPAVCFLGGGAPFASERPR